MMSLHFWNRTNVASNSHHILKCISVSEMVLHFNTISVTKVLKVKLVIVLTNYYCYCFSCKQHTQENAEGGKEPPVFYIYIPQKIRAQLIK